MLCTAIALLAAQGAYHLVWSDEFNVDGKPDPTKWTYEVGYIRNHEVQYYTKRPENAICANGMLVITALKDNWQGHPVTSASLQTRGRASWTYGRIKVRAKVPRGVGTWPAIWTLGSNIDTVGWPACGEIDAMEYVGFIPEQLHFNIHQPVGGTGVSVTQPHPWNNFHIYQVDWTPDSITWSLDGTQVLTYNKTSSDPASWPYFKNQFLILNLAIGGDWGGQDGVDDSIYPAKFLVDWVRVYQRGS